MGYANERSMFRSRMVFSNSWVFSTLKYLGYPIQIKKTTTFIYSYLHLYYYIIYKQKEAKKEMEKRERATAQSDRMDELVCKACALEGCDKGMPCFGGSNTGLCVEAIAMYNELREKELLSEAST